MAGIRSHPPAAVHAPEDRGGGDDNDTLPLRSRGLSGAVYSELDIPLLCGEPLELGARARGDRANGALFRFLLDILHQVSSGNPSQLYTSSLAREWLTKWWQNQSSQGQEVCPSCISHTFQLCVRVRGRERSQ